jgi:hypothetical protein
MQMDPEIMDFLLKHLQSVQDNDIETYHATTHEDLTLYEWWVTPHRLDGLEFHDFMLAESARRGITFGSDADAQHTGERLRTRFDLSNLRIQRFGDAVIASYTLLVSTGSQSGVNVVAHNESRVMVKIDGNWKVVHAHKSPAWAAPHVQPG